MVRRALVNVSRNKHSLNTNTWYNDTKSIILYLFGQSVIAATFPDANMIV